MIFMIMGVNENGVPFLMQFNPVRNYVIFSYALDLMAWETDVDVCMN